MIITTSMVVVAFEPAGEFQPIHSGHPDVHEGEIEEVPPDKLEGLFAAAGRGHLISRGGQRLPEGFADRLLVVDNKNPEMIRHRESVCSLPAAPYGIA